MEGKTDARTERSHPSERDAALPDRADRRREALDELTARDQELGLQ